MSNGWICPQCGYSWSLAVVGCYNCNRPDHEKTTISTTGTAALSPHERPRKGKSTDAKAAE